MQMLYCFINNIHVDYAELLWEGIHYSLLHTTSSIPYPRFTKIIISHYMTNFPKISRRTRDKYHNLKDDDLIKIYLIKGYKDNVGMKIPDWMIIEAMKQTEHYRMYAEVFGIDVPLIQSSPTESTQGMHRTPSTPRLPTSKVDAAESSVPTRSTVIWLRLPQQKSIRLTPPAPVLTVYKADELILQDTLQVSLVEHKSRQEHEARENVALVEKHLASEEIEKMVEGQEHVVDEHNIPGTRLEPMSDKESLESFGTLANHLHNAVTESLPVMVDKHVKEQVEQQVPEQVRNQVPVYVTEGLGLERQKNKEEMENMIAKAILQELRNIQAQISSQIQQAIANDIPSQVDASVRSYFSGHILHVHPAQPKTTSVPKQQYQLYLSMKDDPQLQQQDITIWLALQMKFERLQIDPYASDDDEIQTKQVPQDIMEEVSLNVDEAKLKKINDEMLRQRCTLEDKHQYHIDQMKNFLKSDIIWESHKEILVSPHPRKTTPLVLSCQIDPEAPALSLINQGLLYLKKGNSRPEKIVLSLYKFPIVVFNDNDIKERTSRWLNKCVQKFNPYGRYGVKHWKNPHAKIFYIMIIARRANDCITSITELDFKNLNKNDIEAMYLLIMNRDLTKDEVEYLKLFEEHIEDRLKYRRQIRRWESYVNGRPPGLRRERLE
nr:hypothetical protein [Tanacetum cinerariifolium]